MEMSVRVFITNGCGATSEMFRKRGWETTCDFSKDFDAICFTGGADVSPFYYGERTLPSTRPHFPRDIREVNYWKSLSPDFPKFGICRGAQLGNILSGGRLWQDVNGHHGNHKVQKSNGEITEVTSIHHQMCIPNEDAFVEATANLASRKVSEYKVYTIPYNKFEDVEAFYYWKTEFLGVQWHPEFGHKPSTDYFFDLLDQYYPKLTARAAQ
jgi:putative glutamine amidotransferase